MSFPRKVSARGTIGTVLLAAAALVGLPASSQTIRTTSGVIEGRKTADGTSVFLGIPYAAAPVGDLRWRPPAPAVPWQGIRAARQFGPGCPQKVVPSGFPARDGGYGEDCLYLNIWMPAKASAARLPVMVWIYGGGFQFGSGAVPLYDGSQLARQGVILVTFNYRLGVFGFMVHPELSQESPHHTSGNYGILDQIAALQWIKDNAAAFGGDPQRVTIFGESAGSTAANILQASPLAKGLFAGVIGESTSQMDAAGGLLGRQSLSQAEQYGSEFAAGVGASSIAQMRRIPADTLLKQAKMFWPLSHDGYVLPDDVYEIFAAGRQNDVPLMVGSNASEGSNLRVPWIKPETPEEQTAFSRLYPNAGDTQVYTDTVEWQMRSWADLQATTGHAKSYLYWFDHNPPSPPGALPGPIHGSEIVYVFGNFAQLKWPWTSADRRLGEVMSKYWVNFAATGNPNGTGLPDWPAYRANSPQAMKLSDDAHAISAPGEPAYQFIDTYFRRRRALAVENSSGAAVVSPLNIDLSGNGAPLAASVPDIALDPHDPSRVYVVWRFIEVGDPPSGAGKQNWECHLSTSTDGGAHFSDQVLVWNMPDTPRCNAPYVEVANDGHVYVGASLMSLQTPPIGGMLEHPPFGRAVIAESTDGGHHWLPTVSAIATDSTGRFAPNPAVPEEATRTPWDGARGVIDHTTGAIYVSGGFPAPPGGALHSQRFYSMSADGGKSFGSIRAYGSSDWPERWDSHIIAANGVLAVSYVAGSVPDAGATCPCIVFATSADKGVTLHRHLVAPVKNLDTLVHYPPIAADPNHAGIYALAIVSEDKAQVSVLTSADAGAHWIPSQSNQPTDVVSVSRPALAYTPQSQLLVMWRGYHADGRYDVYVAAVDPERKMSPAVKLSTDSSSIPQTLKSHYAVRGDFLNVLAADRQFAHAAWTDWRTGTEARVYYGRVPLAALGGTAR